MPLLPFSDASPPTTDASLLTSGTLADARLSANVPLLNATTNTFTGSQSVPSLNIPYIADDSSSNLLSLSGDISFFNSTKTKQYGGLYRSFTSSNLVLTNSTNANSNYYPAVILSDNGNAKIGSLYTQNGLLLASSGQCWITAQANTSALTVTNSVTLTNTTPLLSLRSAWSTSGVAQGILLNITTDTGASNASSTLLDLQMAGVSRYALTKSRQFWLYNSSPATQDASNFERGFMRWNSNILEIGTEAGGTGMQRQLSFPLGTTTVSTPLLITQTWNGGSTVRQTAIKVNITDLSSGPSSYYLECQNGGATYFAVRKDGAVFLRNLIQESGIATTVTPANNGDLVIEQTSNSSITFKMKGTDGTVRTATLALV